jgi:hypothetical protein
MQTGPKEGSSRVARSAEQRAPILGRRGSK